MIATVADRRAFVRELEKHELVEDIDFTRDGYQTVLLKLRDSTGENR